MTKNEPAPPHRDVAAQSSVATESKSRFKQVGAFAVVGGVVLLIVGWVMFSGILPSKPAPQPAVTGDMLDVKYDVGDAPCDQVDWARLAGILDTDWAVPGSEQRGELRTGWARSFCGLSTLDDAEIVFTNAVLDDNEGGAKGAYDTMVSAMRITEGSGIPVPDGWTSATYLSDDGLGGGLALWDSNLALMITADYQSDVWKDLDDRDQRFNEFALALAEDLRQVYLTQ